MLGPLDSLCKAGWYSMMRMKSDVSPWFADIDECKTGLAKCSKQSYCRNAIGSYYCSCIPNSSFNFVAGFFTLSYKECYGKDFQKLFPMWKGRGEGRFWKLHPFQARVREHRCVLALILDPPVIPGNRFSKDTTQAPSTNHCPCIAVL